MVAGSALSDVWATIGPETGIDISGQWERRQRMERKRSLLALLGLVYEDHGARCSLYDTLGRTAFQSCPQTA